MLECGWTQSSNQTVPMYLSQTSNCGFLQCSLYFSQLVNVARYCWLTVYPVSVSCTCTEQQIQQPYLFLEQECAWPLHILHAACMRSSLTITDPKAKADFTTFDLLILVLMVFLIWREIAVILYAGVFFLPKAYNAFSRKSAYPLH